MSTCPSGCQLLNTSRSVTRISIRIAAHGNRDVSEILLPVIVLAPAHAIAAHGVVDFGPCGSACTCMNSSH
jgi:hypothetical protein